ncbi:hypothetical protein [Cognatiyoonia koreensis]|uniref:hypothetical protein n=1 Tax=Cognatiyoonia koreensis TaxID=364200 RepID=UPI000B0A7470|nr:hypothetical protein [Cognatiyoonia koreensis]
MFKQITAATVLALLTMSPVAAQDSAEALAWEAAKATGTSAEVFEFIEQYPNGEFTKEAKAYMIDLLWVELAANAPEQATVVEVAVADSVPVTFSTPLTEGSADIVGMTLEKLIDGTPLYPPVEGLPESYWKDQNCSNCHTWEQANLCTQANSYLTDAGAENLVKKHPYGGTFKMNLRNWAQGGCE